MNKTIDLAPPELAIVRGILRDKLPAGTRAWVFGSRATATARRYSDLDLAIELGASPDSDLIGKLAEALSESDLPYKVDVVDLSSLDSTFRAIIEPDMIPLSF